MPNQNVPLNISPVNFIPNFMSSENTHMDTLTRKLDLVFNKLDKLDIIAEKLTKFETKLLNVMRDVDVAC